MAVCFELYSVSIAATNSVAKLSIRAASARMLLKIVVVGDDRGDGRQQSRGSGDQRFGDSRSDGAQAGGAARAQPGKRPSRPRPCRTVR